MPSARSSNSSPKKTKGKADDLTSKRKLTESEDNTNKNAQSSNKLPVKKVKDDKKAKSREAHVTRTSSPRVKKPKYNFGDSDEEVFEQFMDELDDDEGEDERPKKNIKVAKTVKKMKKVPQKKSSNVIPKSKDVKRKSTSKNDPKEGTAGPKTTPSSKPTEKKSTRTSNKGKGRSNQQKQEDEDSDDSLTLTNSGKSGKSPALAKVKKSDISGVAKTGTIKSQGKSPGGKSKSSPFKKEAVRKPGENKTEKTTDSSSMTSTHEEIEIYDISGDWDSESDIPDKISEISVSSDSESDNYDDSEEIIVTSSDDESNDKPDEKTKQEHRTTRTSATRQKVTNVTSVNNQDERRRNEDISKMQSLVKAMEEMQKKYESMIKTKDDELGRLRKVVQEKDETIARMKNTIKWKTDQVEELTDLGKENVELESKISAMLGNEEIYKDEVKKSNEVDKKPASKKNEKAKEKEQTAPEAEEDSGGKTRRRSLRKRGDAKKKSNDGFGEELDALLVTSDDEGKKSEADMKESDKENEQSKVDDEKDKEENKEDSGEKSGETRKEIRKLLGVKKIREETISAAKDEKERRERVKKLREKHIRVDSTDPKTKQPITTRLVLATVDDEGKTPIVEVLPRLLKKLKPHQVEAVEFMWDCVMESVSKYKEGNSGSGCILAHCMGLGKTLSIVTLLHTLMTSKPVKMKRCLIVAPLNTVLNWQREWCKWLEKKDRVRVYELASCKNIHERTETLAKWLRSGGIMIMGYQIFRILVNCNTRSQKKKRIFKESLLDPGPDIVVCDEGHMLKNDSSAISKALNTVKTKRRIILTGTPLQNNLSEYHCMVNYVKPNLLGSRKEFSNRFINPITNGQHSDSTPYDVKLMKRRAHILHESLAGCVQRRDYSALTKFLPPKHEYVISVRMSKLQIELYKLYLNTQGYLKNGKSYSYGQGAGLFSDFQNLMRVWTHPWVLKLEQERQERQADYYGDQDDELDSLLSDSDVELIELSDDEEEEAAAKGNSSESEEITISDESDVEEDEDKEEEEVAKKEKTIEDTIKKLKRRTSRRIMLQAQHDHSDHESEVGKDNGIARKKLSAKDKKDSPVANKKTAAKNADAEEKSVDLSNKASEEKTDDNDDTTRKSKVIAGEVIKQWKSISRRRSNSSEERDLKRKKPKPWWSDQLSDEDEKNIELSGKLVIMLEILRLAETLGDKVLIFSQSILTLDLLEKFLEQLNAETETQQKESKKRKSQLTSWEKGSDYVRMDGSTSASNRKLLMEKFNRKSNARLRLFLISTKAGGLGVNLEAANRVIIFDASWNPSHDIQSIFRVYRFGQEKDVFVYRFLAQGTMEEKIYDRQINKETLSQRVVDENQMDRHFTANDLAELYKFTPDTLDDPQSKERPIPKVPKDIILAELLSKQKEWIVQYHEHDSLLENRPEENLTEEEREAAWEEYEREKQGLLRYQTPGYNPGGMTHSHSMPNFNAMQYSNNPHASINQSNLYHRVAMMQSAAQRPVSSQLQAYNQAISSFSSSDVLKSQPTVSYNMHIQQLPRVVQEILKYNPSISPADLQTRLQAFMGMHNKSITSSNSSSVSSLPDVSAPRDVAANMLPVQTVTDQSSEPQDLSIKKLPSRLPQPGMVPAFKK